MAKSLNAAFKRILVHSREELISLYERSSNLTLVQAQERLNDPDITLFERSVLKSLLADLEVSKWTTLKELMERVFGKTVQPISAHVGNKSLEELIHEAGEIEI